jgi:hypothetical protein
MWRKNYRIKILGLRSYFDPNTVYWKKRDVDVLVPGIYHAAGIVHENIQLLILFTELLRMRQVNFFIFPLDLAT